MAADEKTSLLTLEERAICERVSNTGETPHNQRAQALLALDEGLSQIEASERAGLTAGQVRYWLSKFRQQRTEIFRQELQAQTASAQSVPVEAPEKEPGAKGVEEATEEAQPTTTDEKKDKKSKKAKGKKKKPKKLKEKSSKKKKDSKKKKVAKKGKDKKKKDKKKKNSKKGKK